MTSLNNISSAEFTLVEGSSSVKAYYWERQRWRIYIIFQSTPNTAYEYHCNATDLKRFLAAPSVGRYVRENFVAQDQAAIKHDLSGPISLQRRPPSAAKQIPSAVKWPTSNSGVFRF